MDKGVTREEVYRAPVQRNAMKAWEEGADFKETLLEDPEILKQLAVAEIESAFDVEDALRWVDAEHRYRVFS